MVLARYDERETERWRKAFVRDGERARAAVYEQARLELTEVQYFRWKFWIRARGYAEESGGDQRLLAEHRAARSEGLETTGRETCQLLLLSPQSGKWMKNGRSGTIEEASDESLSYPRFL